MKIFVTGSTGMLGRNLVSSLHKKKDVNVLAPSRGELDLASVKTVDDFLKRERPDAIIHCAGKVGGIHANLKSPYQYFLENLEVGISVIESARSCNVANVINIGSAAMYPSGPGEHSETDILTGRLDKASEGYCLGKLAIAKMIEFCNSQYGTNYKTVVPCNLYGEYDNFDPSSSHMIPSVIRKIHNAKLTGRSCEIWGDGHARREFMFARDAVDFIEFAIENYDLLPEYTNIGLGEDYSINEYHSIIADVVGYDGEFYHDLSKPIGAKSRTLNTSTQESLNWKPKHSLKQGVSATYKYFRSLQ